MEELMNIQLTDEQLQMIASVPEDLREGLRTLFIKQAEEAAKAIAQASGNRLRSVKNNIVIDPHDYTVAVLGENPTLATKLELISLAVHHMKPDALEEGKKKYDDDFAKFKGIDFMKVIAATGINAWKSKRDVGNKMLSEYNTLFDNDEKPQHSDEVVDSDTNSSTLADLPIEPPKADDEPEEENTPVKTTRKTKAA